MARGDLRLTKPELLVLDRLQRFIEKNFRQQHPAVRAVVYFLFVALFLYSGFRLIGGDFVVSGFMMTRAGNALSPVRELDIALPGDTARFGTNAEGRYFLVLRPTRYYALLLSGALTVNLIGPDGRQLVQPQQLRIDRFTQTFDHLVLEQSTLRFASTRQDTPSRQWLFAPGGSAYAAAPSESLVTDRVFIDSIYAPQSSSAQTVRIDLASEDRGIWVYPDAGETPIAAGITVKPASTRWFEVPRHRNQPLKAVLKLRSGIWPFNSVKEDISIVVPSGFSAFEVRSASGFRLTLRTLGSTDLFASNRLPLASRQALENILLNAGIRSASVQDHDRWPGYVVLTISKDTEASDVQSVLRAAIQSGIVIHGLRIDLTMVRQIWLGGTSSRAIARQSSKVLALTPDTVRALIDAKDMAEFNNRASKLYVALWTSMTK